jgi:hypothetical protein
MDKIYCSYPEGTTGFACDKNIKYDKFSYKWCLYELPTGVIFFGIDSKTGEIKYLPEWESKKDLILDMFSQGEISPDSSYPWNIFQPYDRDLKLQEILWDSQDTTK